jgi:4-hydroxy-3-polyprenylbenzoate decarboxylase
MSRPRRIVVGVTGATGTVYAVRLLLACRSAGLETHLVVSSSGELTRATETDLTRAQLHGLADVVHRPSDFTAAVASGSFATMGMVVAPCSVRTLSAIAYGTTDNLLTRAADVTLKERRRLVLLFRETPLTLGHIRAMAAVTESGAVVFPPVPAFYTRPETLHDIVEHTVARVLDQFGLSNVLDVPRWATPA